MDKNGNFAESNCQKNIVTAVVSHILLAYFKYFMAKIEEFIVTFPMKPM